MRKLIIYTLLTTFVFSSFMDDADARRRKRRSKKKRAPIINEKKLYERIGGEKRMNEIVQEWIRMNLDDTRVATSFEGLKAKPDRLASFRKVLGTQMCEIADGPCQHKGEELKKSHAEVKIDETQFLVLGENLFKSMEKYNIPEREKNEMMGRLGEIKAEVVQGASSES